MLFMIVFFRHACSLVRLFSCLSSSRFLPSLLPPFPSLISPFPSLLPSFFSSFPLQSFFPKSNDNLNILLHSISRRFHSPSSLGLSVAPFGSSPDLSGKSRSKSRTGLGLGVGVVDYGPFHPSLVNRGGDVFVLEGKRQRQ